MTAPDTPAGLGWHPARRWTLGDVLAMLADPNAVHVNLVAGTIARPTWAQIMHAYPVESAAALADARAQGRREAMEGAARVADVDDGLVRAGDYPDDRHVGEVAYGPWVAERIAAAIRALAQREGGA